MSFPNCQLCGLRAASCKAHIIPKQFYRRIRGTAPHLFKLLVEKDVHRGFTQNGIWEKGILCTECDRHLGEFDQYAYTVLPNEIDPSRIKLLGQGLRLYDLGVLDVPNFKHFLAAQAWRCSRSSHIMFQYVDLGPYERTFEDILTARDVSGLSQMDCLVIHLAPARYEKMLLPPFRNRAGHINVLQIYLYPWKLLIKIDKRPFEQPFLQTALQGSGPTFATMMTTFSTGELALLTDLQRKIRSNADSGNW